MQIVIDIDDNLYTRLFDNGVDGYDDAEDMAKAIRNGIPLPKRGAKMRKTKKSLKNRVSKIYGSFLPGEVTLAETINANADVLVDLIDEVEFLRKRVDELEKADFSSNRSAEIEEIVDAEMERRMME